MLMAVVVLMPELLFDLSVVLDARLRNFPFWGLFVGNASPCDADQCTNKRAAIPERITTPALSTGACFETQANREIP